MAIQKNKSKKPASGKKTIIKSIEEKHFNLEVIKKLAMHGLTDAELADLLEIDEPKLKIWQKDKAFLHALNTGRLQADLNVEEKLYAKATGYSHPEVHVSTYQGKVTVTEITKYYAPDTSAAIFWLKNRRGWSDKQEVKHSGDIKIVINGIEKV